MQSSGTLAELSLEGILDSIQKDRATGTLHLRSSAGEATLYFLFGHLFHAVDPSELQGEPVVHRALGWASGDFTFDAKAKLPAEETIKVSTAELLANRPASNGNAAEAAPVTEPEAVADPGANGAAASLETVGPEATNPAADEPAPAIPAETGGTASSGEKDLPRRRRSDQRPASRPPGTMALYPVPIGKSLHQGLTAGFVDFPKLLRSLARDSHSGYVRLKGDGFTSVLLFASGAVVEAIHDGDGQVSTGTGAFSAFGDRIDFGDGDLDVIQLTPEMVTGIYQLLTYPSTYERLLARFIKPDALLEYLGEQGTSGAVIVRNKASVGIVVFRDGQILGSYTDAARAVSDSTAAVIAICDDPTAEIEVRGGEVPATLPVLDQGQGKSRGVATGSTPAIRLPAAPAVAPPVKSAPAPVAEVATPVAVEPSGAGAPEDQGAPESGTATVGERDWAAAINEMAGRADAVLGTRSKKVKELLYAANHDRQGIDSTIARISELSIMFVDPSKLSSLSDEFRQIADRSA